MKNSKSEIRNPKQIQITKIQNSKRFWLFEHLNFEFVSNLGFRISDFRRRRAGFTLIELIIYLAIVSIFLVSISYLALDILGGQAKSYGSQEINQNIRFVTNFLTKDIKSAQDIGNLSSDFLVLTMPGDDITYNFNSTNLTLTRQIGSNDPVVVNSDQVEVIGSFTNLSYTARNKNIGIDLTISRKNPDNLPDYNASTTVDLSFELRGRR